jgi:hypothetical protein
VQGLAHWRTPDRRPELFQTWCATPNSHRPVQKFRALMGNPRASQQLMGQSPICCCLKAKKFNDFSRACTGALRTGPKSGTPASANSGLIAGFREISVRTRMRGGPGRSPTLGRINGLQKVRVEMGRLIGKGDFSPTRTIFITLRDRMT